MQQLSLNRYTSDDPLKYSTNVLIIVLPPQNFPLYLRTANPQSEADLQFQYLVHASIDVVEEKSESCTTCTIT